MKENFEAPLKIIIMFIIVINVIQAECQEIGNYTPLEFEEHVPKWSSVIYDSSIINHVILNPRDKYAGFDGYSHIYYHSTITSKPLIEDDYYFRVVWTSYDTDLSGGLVEKIDLRSGQTIWKSVFDLRTNDKREFVKKAEIVNGRLVLYNIEITDKDLAIPIPIVFAFQAKGLLKVREYDLSTGKLLKILSADSAISGNRILTTDLFNRIQVNTIDSSTVEIFEHVHKDNNGSFLTVDTVSVSGILLSNQDTIKSRFTNVDWGDCHWSSNYKMVKDEEGTLFYIDSYIPGDFTQYKPMVIVRAFRNGKETSIIDLNYLNLDNHVDSWTLLDVNKHYILVFSANFNYTGDYIIVDTKGNLINKFNFSSRNNDLSPALGPNGTLIFAKSGKNNIGGNTVDFYQSKDDSFKLISSFSITNPNHVAVPSRLINLRNGDFLLDVMHSEEVGSSTKGRFHTTMRFSPEQLGIATNTNDDTKITGFLLFPNPTFERFKIESKESYNEFIISKLDGIKVKYFSSKEAYFDMNHEFDVSELPKGVYLCEMKHFNKTIGVLKFVKI